MGVKDQLWREHLSLEYHYPPFWSSGGQKYNKTRIADKMSSMRFNIDSFVIKYMTHYVCSTLVRPPLPAKLREIEKFSKFHSC